MEMPAQQCTRLLAALEDLLAQESLLIGMEDYAAVRAVQQRVAPLIERLVELAPAADASARQRATVVIALRNQNLAQIALQLNRVREELEQTREARSRLTYLAPVYRMTPPSTARRLRATG
jgi:hypothetical protein